MLGDHLVDDVVLMQRDDTKPPAGAAEVLRVRVDADGVSRQRAHQRTEAVDEGAVHVIGQDDEVGPFGLDEIDQQIDRIRVERYTRWVAGVDQEECLDLRIFQLLESRRR